MVDDDRIADFGWLGQIAQDATTEVRMIAGTVFSTLNEAWDKFKAENNM